MFDCFNRKINYLRISVTDRCNLRCNYCMPEAGVKLIGHNEILTYDEIIAVVKIAVSKGINKIRITGGEPLVRKGIVTLVEMIANIDGIDDFGMTTNGILLSEFAQDLKKAGLHRINISLDTMNPGKYKEITRRGNINDVIKGILAAQKVGFYPIKINCVIQESINEPDAISVTEFCKSNNLEIRYIKKMDLDAGKFWKVHGGEGGNCDICNRLRLTANGFLKPCLFSNIAIDIRENGISKAMEMAINQKPKSGTINTINSFNNIGG